MHVPGIIHELVRHGAALQDAQADEDRRILWNQFPQLWPGDVDNGVRALLDWLARPESEPGGLPQLRGPLDHTTALRELWLAWPALGDVFRERETELDFRRDVADDMREAIREYVRGQWRWVKPPPAVDRD